MGIPSRIVLSTTLLLLRCYEIHSFTTPVTLKLPQFALRAESEEETPERITFDQAGASLMDEENEKKLGEMGGEDSNPAFQQETSERLRAAIRARTAELGMVEDQASKEYIAAREQAAIEAGPGGPQNDQVFGGIDLSKISSTQVDGDKWNEELPTMLYDPVDEMTQEEQEEADPLMTKPLLEQAQYELSEAKWPTAGGAVREVLTMFLVAAGSVFFIDKADELIRALMVKIHFSPTEQEVVNYMNRFDGLDLPSGLMDNVNEDSLANMATQLDTATKGGGLPGP